MNEYQKLILKNQILIMMKLKEMEASPLNTELIEAIDESYDFIETLDEQSEKYKINELNIVKRDIEDHILKSNTDFSDWFICTTNISEGELLDAYNVDYHSWWIYRTINDISDTKDIFDYFIDKGVSTDEELCNTKGLRIFAFKRTDKTIPKLINE